MSKIRLTPNASGTGTVTLTVPSTSTDRTITLPDNSGDIITTATANTILQVKQFAYSGQRLSNNNTYIDTNLTLDITPSSTSSKILMTVHQTGLHKQAGDTAVVLKAVRVLGGVTTNLGVNFEVFGSKTYATNAVGSAGASCVYLDSPNTTSTVTYKTQFYSRDNRSEVFVQVAGAQSTMVLMELAG